MAKSISLRILTGEGLALSDEAVSVIAPGALGYLGMLKSHAPLVSTIRPGKLIWRKSDGSQKTVLVTDGIMEIQSDNLTIITSSISAADSQQSSS